jgi:hypothetical protein
LNQKDFLKEFFDLKRQKEKETKKKRDSGGIIFIIENYLDY